MKLTLNEITQRLESLEGWEYLDNSIIKKFKFNDFNEAINFVNKVANLAEQKDHHPAILINYNMVTLTLTTHAENSVTIKDFELAKEIDKL